MKLLVLLLPVCMFGDCVCNCVNGRNVSICSNPYEMANPCPPTFCPPPTPQIPPMYQSEIPPMPYKSCNLQQVYNNTTQTYEYKKLCN